MYKYLLGIFKLGWLAPAIEPALTAKSDPSPDNIELAITALTEAIIAEYKPEILPEVQAVEAVLPPLMHNSIAMAKEPNVANGEALASSMLALVKVFVPAIPEEDANIWLVSTGKLLASVGVK